MKRAIISTAVLSLCLGCSSVYPVGHIGDHLVYHAVTRDLFAPCTSTIFTLGADNTLMKVDGGVGPSIAGQFLGPASVTAAGIYIGKGLEKSGDEINETNNLAAGAEGGSAVGGAGGSATGGAGGIGGAGGDGGDSTSTATSTATATSSKIPKPKKHHK